MTPYSFPSIEYKGQEIEVKATTNAGAVATPSGTAQTTALRFFLDDEIKMVVSVTTDAIASQYAAGVQALKDEIDNLDEAGKILVELGASEDGELDQVATPTGFVLSQIGGPGGNILMDWDSEPVVEGYEIQTAPDAGFALTSTTYGPPSIDPYDAGPYPVGMLYVRIRAKISGMMDSEWAATSINVT